MVDLRTIIDELNMLARHAGYHSSEVADRIESEGIAPPDGFAIVPIEPAANATGITIDEGFIPAKYRRSK